MDKRFKIVTGIFNPKHLETLKPRLLPFIGKEFEFQYAWIIEDVAYEGQYAMSAVDYIDGFCAWVPEEDVDILGVS